MIAGKYGDYRIVTCKDVTNQKNSINLYRTHMEKSIPSQRSKLVTTVAECYLRGQESWLEQTLLEELFLVYQSGNIML